MKREQRYSKRNYLACGMAVCLFATMVAGCSNQNAGIDYVSEAPGENESGTPGGMLSAENGLEQYRDEKKWEDSWSIDLADGEMKVDVAAGIKLIGATSMSVVECKYIPFDETLKKQVVKGFFGDGDVYHYELPYRSPEELTVAISYLEEQIETLDAMEEYLEESEFVEARNAAQKQLDACREAVENGSNEYEIVTDYTGTAFWGEKDGVAYAIEFLETPSIVPMDGYREIMIYPMDMYLTLCTKNMELSFDEDENTKKDADNMCIYSQDEAMDMAEDMLTSFGIFGQEAVKLYNLDWAWYDMVDEYVMQYIRGELNGYVFYFGVPIDESIYAPELDTKTDYIEQGVLSTTGREIYEQHTVVYVDSTGIARMYIQNPIEIQQKTEDVALLSLDSIKGIIESEVKGRTDYYNSKYCNDSYIKYSSLTLEYYRMENQLEADSFSYIPVWHLSCVMNEAYDVYVNAMDGTIIDHNFLHILGGEENAQ